MIENIWRKFVNLVNSIEQRIKDLSKKAKIIISVIIAVLGIGGTGIITASSQDLGPIWPTYTDRLYSFDGNLAWTALAGNGNLQAQTDGMWVGRSANNNMVFNATNNAVGITPYNGATIDIRQSANVLGASTPPNFLGGWTGTFPNYIHPQGYGHSILGGGWGFTDLSNQIIATGSGWSVIINGTSNRIYTGQTIIGAGNNNIIFSGGNSGILTGEGNYISGEESAIVGGRRNTITSTNAIDIEGFIGGGDTNTIEFAGADDSSESTIGGGKNNTVTGSDRAFIGGGDTNTTTGDYATIPGGASNTAAGNYSLAAGRRAKANHDGTFVWADSVNADFPSEQANQFAVRATGGISATTTGMGLKIDGPITLTVPVWDDLRVPLNQGKTAGVNVPIFEEIASSGVYAYNFDDGDEIWFATQMPHSYMLGEDIFPHVHWGPETDSSPADNVGLGLECSWTNLGGDVDSTTVYTRVVSTGVDNQYAHLLHDVPDGGWDGSSYDTLSALILCRFYRFAAAVDNYAGGIFAYEIDFHYPVDTLGSPSIDDK